MSELYFILIVIFVFSLVQSIFGVGLLLFGTPTLLFAGYSYGDSLWILLPPSVAISVIQLVNNYKFIYFKREIYILTIPALVTCLVFILVYEQAIDIKQVVGVGLLFVGVVRMSSRLRVVMENIIANNDKIYYLIMGAIHGLSNMGGGPLSVLMTAMYDDKYSIQTNIAHVYFIFGVSQLVVLTILSNSSFEYANFLFVIIALSVYFFVGRGLTHKIRDSSFNLIISVLVIAYGITALVVV